jgi:hypothetical protein
MPPNRYPQQRSTGASIQPRYVGAPVERVDDLEDKPVRYSPDQFVAAENTWWGLGITPIAAGAVALILPAFLPDRPIVPIRFLCPSTVVGLLVLQIRISGTDLLVGNLGTPIEFFSEVSTAPNIDWLTIQTTPGVQFTLSNPTLNPLNFVGGFYGTQLRS